MIAYPGFWGAWLVLQDLEEMGGGGGGEDARRIEPIKESDRPHTVICALWNWISAEVDLLWRGKRAIDMLINLIH